MGTALSMSGSSGIVEFRTNEAYARLLMGRTLQRQQRHEEARGHIALAKALGQPVESR